MWWGCLDYFKLLMRVPYNLLLVYSSTQPRLGWSLRSPPARHWTGVTMTLVMWCQCLGSRSPTPWRDSLPLALFVYNPFRPLSAPHDATLSVPECGAEHVFSLLGRERQWCPADPFSPFCLFHLVLRSNVGVGKGEIVVTLGATMPALAWCHCVPTSGSVQ